MKLLIRSMLAQIFATFATAFKKTSIFNVAITMQYILGLYPNKTSVFSNSF